MHLKMDYFFTRAFRGVKYGLSIAGGAACGIVIILGALGINTVLIPICGGIAFIPMAFIFFENTKVIRDMEKLVTQLKDELKEFTAKLQDFKLSVTQLGVERDEIRAERIKVSNVNESLGKKLAEADQTIQNLQKNLTQSEELSMKLKESLNKSEQNNQYLKETTEQLMKLKADREKQIQELNQTIVEVSEQLKLSREIGETYKIQLLEFENNNEKLKAEVDRVQGMYDKAKEVVSTILKSQEIFQEIQQDMAETESATKDNVSKMERLLEIFGKERTEEMFATLDRDNDGSLTREEFMDGLLSVLDK